MLLKTFLKASLFLCFSLAQSSCARIPAIWLPARILGATYPHEAKSARIQGIVDAKCSIRQNGSVAAVTILSGHPILARSVKANLLQWTFRLQDGSSNHNLETLIVYNFQLKGDCDWHSGCKELFWFDYPGKVSVISEVPRILTER
jgi:hypothetical protein